MFEIPHATNFHIMVTFQWCICLFSGGHSFRILGLQWVHIAWRIILFLTHHMCENCLDIIYIRFRLGKLTIPFLRIILHIVKLIIYFVNFVSILFRPMGIMNLEWWSAESQTKDNGYEIFDAIWRRWALIRE